MTFDYKKIPLCLGVLTIIGSGLLAHDTLKHNNLVPQAKNKLHQLRQKCDVLNCTTVHNIIDLSELESNEKRNRSGIYNAWYYEAKGKLAASAGSIAYMIAYANEDVQYCYTMDDILPENSVQQVFEDTLKKALEATIIHSYDNAILTASVGVIFFGIYFYNNTKNNFYQK